MKKLGYILGAVMIVVGFGVASIKNIESTEYGTQITFRDNTGYYIEYSK